MIGISNEIRVAHVNACVVILESNMDARSARID